MKNLKKHFYKKKIVITGHTGFKGSWLTLWLQSYGAQIYGISNGYPSKPSNFKILKLSKKINHILMDLRNSSKLKKIINNIKPDYIFHLAAQPLIYTGYKKPFETYNINFNGSLNIVDITLSAQFIKSLTLVIRKPLELTWLLNSSKLFALTFFNSNLMLLPSIHKRIQWLKPKGKTSLIRNQIALNL